MVVQFNLESTGLSAEMELLRVRYRYWRLSLSSSLRRPRKVGRGLPDESRSWTTCLRGDRRTGRSHLMTMVSFILFLQLKSDVSAEVLGNYEDE